MNKYFKRSEFACKCGCGFDTVDYELLRVLTELRRYFNAPITINSACRCEKHNKSVGGSSNSQHLLGKASDIVVRGIKSSSVTKAVSEINSSVSVGLYNNFTHIDVRKTQTYWRGAY